MSNSKKPQPIDLTGFDFDKARENTTEKPGVLPYAHHSGSAIIKPEDKGKLKRRAVSSMQQQTDMQMTQLYKQMELLASQAKAIQARVTISERVYQAEMPFEPLINHVYYLYRSKKEKDILAMVGPNEWGKSFPFKSFIAEVKLLADHTWDILSKAEDF